VPRRTVYLVMPARVPTAVRTPGTGQTRSKPGGPSPTSIQQHLCRHKCATSIAPTSAFVHFTNNLANSASLHSSTISILSASSRLLIFAGAAPESLEERPSLCQNHFENHFETLRPLSSFSDFQLSYAFTRSRRKSRRRPPRKLIKPLPRHPTMIRTKAQPTSSSPIQRRLFYS